MIKTIVKFHIFDLPPGFKDAQFELADGARVNEVLDACLALLEQRGTTMDENELRTATVLINGKWRDVDDPVSDGDVVTIIRPMDGG
ncbi:MAG: MoaD/ThiS family protein [Oscillospiraceae bacterium]|nr:MoaD/ThiS family protein [Oscillospiraceae bacterium]